MPSVLNLPNERRMVEVVREGLSWAEHACFAVSFTRCSGLGLIIDPLREMIERKGRVQLLTSTYQSITQPEALSALLKLKGLECFLQDGRTGFHSKFWLFDKTKTKRQPDLILSASLIEASRHGGGGRARRACALQRRGGRRA